MIPPETISMLRHLDAKELLAEMRRLARAAGRPEHLYPNQTEEFYEKSALAEAHKIRLATEPFSTTERAESRKWLLENGFTTTLGGPHL